MIVMICTYSFWKYAIEHSILENILVIIYSMLNFVASFSLGFY